MEKIKEQNGFTLYIEQDNNCSSPRENDNIGNMALFHGRYELGDKVNDRVKQFSSPEDLHEFMKANEKKGIVSLPVYMYDHSGLTVSTSPFSCPWDSGQVGYIFVTAADWKTNYGGKIFKRARALEILESEVKEYNDFLTGNCWGYIVKDAQGETVDSCWGFIGDQEYCKDEGLSALKWQAENETKQKKAIDAVMAL